MEDTKGIKIGDVFIVEEYNDLKNTELESIFICTVNEITNGNIHSIVDHIIIKVGNSTYSIDDNTFVFSENEWDKQMYFKMKRLEKDYKEKYPEYFI